jgi:hypothetical protein
MQHRARWRPGGYFELGSRSVSDTEPLLALKPKIRDPQARCVVTHDALDILREAVGGLGVNIERQRHPGAPDAIQLAEDRLGDVADLRRWSIA